MESKYPVKNSNLVLGLFIYFIVFSFVLPTLASRLTLLEDPMAVLIPLKYQFLMYLITFILLLFVIYPLLRAEKVNSWKSIVSTTIYCILILLLMNMFFNFIMNMIQEPISSNNQATLDTIKYDNKFMYVTMVVILGPLVEEFVFRGLIFRRLWNGGSNFFMATIVSSLLFGFVHIMDSIIIGDYQQLTYLVLYATLGCVFCFSYRKHNTIYACIILHMVYNLCANLSFIFS